MLKLLFLIVTLRCLSNAEIPDMDRNDPFDELCQSEADHDSGEGIELFQECRSTHSCQLKKEGSECLYDDRTKKCICNFRQPERKQTDNIYTEERTVMRTTKRGTPSYRGMCKDRPGHSCSKKSECKSGYRYPYYKCNNKKPICCKKCKNLVGYKCHSYEKCDYENQEWGYQCPESSQVCCKDCKKANPKSCCPSGWIGKGNSCYMFYSHGATWNESIRRCDILDATLVSVHSLEEMYFLYDHLQAPFWTGMHDINNEGVYENQDGSPVDFEPFLPNQPNNNNNQDCVMVEKSASGFYLGINDKNCSLQLAYACKIPEEDNCN